MINISESWSCRLPLKNRVISEMNVGRWIIVSKGLSSIASYGSIRLSWKKEFLIRSDTGRDVILSLAPIYNNR